MHGFEAEAGGVILPSTAPIARDRPDILERMKTGEFKSVHAAAVEDGLVRKTITVPVEPRAAARNCGSWRTNWHGGTYGMNSGPISGVSTGTVSSSVAALPQRWQNLPPF